MNFKKVLLLVSFMVIFASIIGASASHYQYETHDMNYISDNFNESELTGCCSVMLQLNGNESMMSFRRDASFPAEIYIEKIDWHGHNAIKQYKEDRGYFCQVIITEEGWMIGYGGIDDGEDNKKIENISASMINDNNTISQSKLSEVQAIKASYGLGHMLIKAPNGNYGLATATNTNTGKLDPGEYVSLPNRYQFSRTGSIDMNSSDKVTEMTELAISDGFGLTRRDVTTFNFHTLENNTFNGSIINIYLSNDDGSMYGLSTAGLNDNVHFNNTTLKGSDLPIAPKYKELGTVELFDAQENSSGGFDFTTLGILVGFVVCVGILGFAVLQLVRFIRFNMSRRR